MSDGIGKIGWIDITVDDATGLRNFYEKVVGWKVEDTAIGDKLLFEPRGLAGGRFCVIEDPSGATAALY